MVDRCGDLQEQATEAAAAAAVGSMPGLDGPPTAGRNSAEIDRDHPFITLITRLAAARAAAQARQAAAAAAGGSGATAAASAGQDGADAAADVEMQQSRPHASVHIGQRPVMWNPTVPAGSATPGSSSNSSSPAADVVQDGGSEEPTEVAAAHRLASLRALMSAIRASALRREGYSQPQGDVEAGDAAAGGSDAASSSASSRQGMV